MVELVLPATITTTSASSRRTASTTWSPVAAAAAPVAVGSSSFTAFSEQVLNFVYVEIEGNQLLLHAIDATGEEFDQLAIDH